jgi:hypothetical protein
MEEYISGWEVGSLLGWKGLDGEMLTKSMYDAAQGWETALRVLKDG